MATKSISPPTAMPKIAPTGVGAEARGDRHRLFFALVPDDRTRSEILRAAEQLKVQQHPRGSWIVPERYHLTLHFLGDYPELPRDKVERASAAAAKVRMPEFDLVFDSASSFRSPSPPWVLRCPEPAEAIRQLWHALSIALIAERIHTETASEFTPHITVLRDADKALAPCAITPVAWHVRDFALMHSQLGRERRYTEIGRWPLAAPGKQSK